MKTKTIIHTWHSGSLRVDVTGEGDSYNGVIMRGDEFLGGVAVGIHETDGIQKVIEKAKKKIELKKISNKF